MQGIGKAFFGSALAYGVLGMGYGLFMAITHNHGQMPTHAHIMVIGWVSFAVFGLFYSLQADRIPRRLALLHFGLAQVSMIGMLVGLTLIYSGQPQYEPIAAVSASAYAVSFLIFAGVAMTAMRSAAD